MLFLRGIRWIVCDASVALKSRSWQITIMAEENNKGHGHDKEFKIIVNGRDKTVTQETLSFLDVVALAFDISASDTTIFTVTYRHAHQHQEDGSLVAGQTVVIKNGTIFNVTATNKS